MASRTASLPEVWRAFSIATGSACGLPQASCHPSPNTVPSRPIRTAPTRGLGLARFCARAARSRQRCIQDSSGVKLMDGWVKRHVGIGRFGGACSFAHARGSRSETWRTRPARFRASPAEPGTLCSIQRRRCPVAQLAERLALDQEVPGSNPGGATATPEVLPPGTLQSVRWMSPVDRACTVR